MQKTTDPISNPCHCINVRRAAGALTAFYDRALAACNLSVGQFSLLWNLETMGESNVTRLAGILGLERTTVVRNLKPLLAAGYIADVTGSTGRDRRLIATEQGKAVLAEAIPLWKQAQKEIRGQIGPETLQVFKDVLLRLQQV